MPRLRRFDVAPHLADKGCDTDAFRALGLVAVVTHWL
jgi:hypothetical protein